MYKLLLLIRTLLFYTGYAVSILVFACICILLGPFLPFKARFRFFTFWNVYALWWLKLCCGIRVEVNGRFPGPEEGPFVIISNHQSAWETIYIYRYFRPVSAILKKELLSIPFFGWAMRLLRPIAIDRSKRLRAGRMVLGKGKETLGAGISVLIFPEGTRAAANELKSFSSSAASLAVESGYPVLPLAHDAGKVWPPKQFLKYPGTIRLSIGEPIPSQGREARELTQAIEAWTRKELSY